MKPRHVLFVCAVCVLAGTSLGVWAQKSGGMDLFRGKSPKEAGQAALVAAERLAGKGSWERIAVGRVYYLIGDKARGQAIFDKVTGDKPEVSDWQRIGDVYAAAGEKEKAEVSYQEAAALEAGDGSWERIALGRAYYLAGDKARGQAIFDRVTGAKPKGSDWQRIGDVYAATGENDKAESCYQRTLAMSPKDDTGQSEIGAWYIRTGRREKGEELFAKAFAKNPNEAWHYVRAAEAYLGLAPQ